MSKRGIQYIKGDEPSFLRKMKEQAGYVEPDTVESKRVKDGDFDFPSDDDCGQTKDDEKPQVVVLSSGDLTEEQVIFHERLAETKPREVGDEKVIFKRPGKKVETGESSKEAESSRNVKDQKKKKLKAVKNKSLLSFSEDDE